MATKLQTGLLEWIARNEYTSENGAYPRNADEASCWLWVDEIGPYLGITVNQAKGVVGSAVESGLVWVQDTNTQDAAIGLTAKGYEAFRAAYPPVN